MITIIIDIGIAICGMFFGMALFSKIMREKNEAYKKALEEIKKLINETCWNYTDISIIPVKEKMLEIINEALK